MISCSETAFSDVNFLFLQKLVQNFTVRQLFVFSSVHLFSLLPVNIYSFWNNVLNNSTPKYLNKKFQSNEFPRRTIRALSCPVPAFNAACMWRKVAESVWSEGIFPVFALHYVPFLPFSSQTTVQSFLC